MELLIRIPQISSSHPLAKVRDLPITRNDDSADMMANPFSKPGLAHPSMIDLIEK
jgi:hypothetical protein